MTIPHHVGAKSPASLQTLYNSTLWADRMGMGWQSVGISPFFASQASPLANSYPPVISVAPYAATWIVFKARRSN